MDLIEGLELYDTKDIDEARNVSYLFGNEDLQAWLTEAGYLAQV